METMDLFGTPEELIDRNEPAKTKRKRNWREDIQQGHQYGLNILCEGFEDLYKWSDEEIERLHIALLKSSVRDLGDKKLSLDSQEEIWEWVNRDDEGPFSFITCLHLYDPRLEPESFRQLLRFQAKKINP